MSRTFGIDLGTTNSAIATMNDFGKPDLIPNAEGQRTTPSVVQVRADGSMLVGDLAKRELVMEKENTAHFFKRDIGTGAEYEFHGRTYTPVDLSAAVLTKLKLDAQAFLSEPVRDVVITVPAYFENSAREETRRAGELAGLNVLQIINEPTAAAITYGFSQGHTSETVLVYDLGGGTFDISLVRMDHDRIEVLGTGGNHALGGKEWDDTLLRFVVGEFQQRHNLDPLEDPILFQELLTRAEDAKKLLGASQKAVVTVSHQGIKDRIEITRQTFEEITADLLAQTEILIEDLLGDLGISLQQIDSVLMVGGSTRMPACRRMISEKLGRPINLTLNPDECVAMGAAIQAANSRPSLPLLGARTVQDVMSHSMGMIAESEDCDRFVNSILIPRNLPIPAQQVMPFQARTSKTRPTSISVYVTQGESQDPSQCSFVGKYVVEDIPHNATGIALIDIRYEYDLDGVVNVSASLSQTGQPLTVVRQPLPDDMSWVFGNPTALRPKLEPVTIYAAVDLSGSMSGQPLRDCQEAIQDFIATLDLGHIEFGIIEFADKVRATANATHDAAVLSSAVAGLSVGKVGIGNGAHPFDQVHSLLTGLPGRKTLVILTDGCWSSPKKAIEAAKRCHAADIEVIAIGFGSADEDFLREIATSMDKSTLLKSSGELKSTFEQVAQVVSQQVSGLGRI